MPAPQPAFRLLGPLEVWADGAPLRLGGERQRALLALLLLRANEVVPSDRLIQELFGLDAPETTANALQVAISRLRRLLGDGILVTRPRGYLLQVEPGALDSELFEQLLGDARRAFADGDADTAAGKLREALALWRGPPLADLTLLEAAQPDVRRLEELRLAALMDRIDADLALGRGAELIPELEGLIDENPLQERLRGQLMVALYRSGRQAEALETYRRTRELLRDELGLQPSPALQQLEREILNHDPALGAPANGSRPVAPPPAKPPRARRRPRGRWIAVAVAAGLAAIAVGALVSVWMRGSDPGLPGVKADSIGVLDRHGKKITAELPLGARPVGVAVGNGALWLSAANGTLTRVDAADLAAHVTIPLGGNPGAVAFGGGAAWVPDQDTGTVTRVDAETNLPVGDRIRVGNGPSAAVFCANAVWIANQTDGSLTRIDPDTDTPSAPIPVGSSPSGLACGSGFVWVADAQDGTVTRVDPRANLGIKTIQVGSGLSAIAGGLGAVWVGSSLDGTVTRIDPATNTTTAIRTGKSVDAVGIHDGSVWAGDAASGTITRIDPADGRPAGRVHVGSAPTSLVSAGDRLVVATLASPASHRGGTLVAAGSDDINFPVTLDPATWWGSLGSTVTSITNDGLVTYRRAPGAAGLVVVPDLASSLPVVTRGGTVQTFVLRPGMRYSNGRAVQASDVRASIERFLRMNGVQGDPEHSLGVVGESACADRRRPCDLSRGIQTDNRARTISFHLTRPNPFFLRLLALPNFAVLPAGTPPREGQRVPATGPYRIAGYEPGRRIALERNPAFRPWSAAAQPAGFPDRIVVRIVHSPDRALDDVVAGRADYLVASTPPPPARLAGLLTHHASQLHTPQQLVGRYLFMNTRVPPFDNRDVRTALNYAVDRDEAVRILGGPHAASKTCQVITASFPGYRPYCPYTLHPNAAGTWVRPDLDRARALVRRSGTHGMKVVLWSGYGPTYFGRTARPIARYIARVLDELGYDVSRRALPGFDPKTGRQPYYDYITDPHTQVQVGVATWAPDLPATSSLVQPLLACGQLNNLARFCDREVEGLVGSAVSLEASDKAAATRLWTEIDRRIVDEAPWVPLATFQWIDVVSRRLGNYQSSPHAALGFLIDQAWVK